MSPEQYAELIATAKHMADSAHALAKAMELFAADEKDAGRHGFFIRLHRALCDCELGIRHTLAAAPAMVQP
jgi:hypothetical protein